MESELKRMTAAATALMALFATLLVFTVVPGSTVLDMNIDMGTRVFAFYVAYVIWAVLTVLVANVFISLWGSRGARA
jgi:hypothetical protein